MLSRICPFPAFSAYDQGSVRVRFAQVKLKNPIFAAFAGNSVAKTLLLIRSLRLLVTNSSISRLDAPKEQDCSTFLLFQKLPNIFVHVAILFDGFAKISGQISPHLSRLIILGHVLMGWLAIEMNAWLETSEMVFETKQFSPTWKPTANNSITTRNISTLETKPS